MIHHHGFQTVKTFKPCIPAILQGLVIPEVLLLVEQVRPRTSEIYDLRTPVSILLQAGAFEAVKGV